MSSRFKIRTSLLEALSKFTADRNHPHYVIACIHVSADRLLATNSHRLVSVPAIATDPNDDDFPSKRIDGEVVAPFLIPGTLVQMHCAAARAVWDETAEDEFGDEYPVSFDRYATTDVSVTDTAVVLEHDGVSMSAPYVDVSKYPDTARLDATLTTEGAPIVSRFNPAFMADAAAVLRATDDQPGLTVGAWDRMRSGCGPTEWRSELGTRFVIMGMAASKKEREAMQLLHNAAFTGKAVQP